MSATHQLCALRLDATQLAAWRDGALGDAQATRMAAHIAGCPACQARLDAELRRDGALRAQHVPQPDERLWRDVRAATRGTTAHSRTPIHTLRVVPALSRIGALAAVLLLVLGFARVYQLRVAGPQARATATSGTGAAHTATALPARPPAAAPITGQAPTWNPSPLPPNAAPVDQRVMSLGIAASAGRTAYLCNSSSTGSALAPDIWQTSDAGARWSLVGHLPAAGNLAQCALSVDVTNPARVIAVETGQDPATLAQIWNILVSDDSGAHWRLVSSTPQQEFDHVTTLGSTSYAVIVTGVGTRHLAASHDGLRSWRVIDGPVAGRITQFWTQPDGSALLADVAVLGAPSTSSRSPHALWQTLDGGAHWSQLSTPPAEGFAVQAQSGIQPWHICGWNYDDAQRHTNPVALFCSTDGGTTWTARPGLRQLMACTANTCGGQAFVAPIEQLDIADDGSLLAVSAGGPQHNGVITQQTGNALYRLPAGSSQWQSLGAINALFYVPTPSGGTLWQYVGGMYLTGFSADLAPHVGGPSGLIAGSIATAPYN
ncbi:MAG: zf-HC2 domain-containing protein [Ktedonobacterales bacterium]